MNTTATTVEERLGDPYDTANPFGFHAIVAAREAGRPLDGEPLDLGDAQDTERLMHAARAVYRRSPALARPPADGAVAAGAAVGALDSGLRIAIRHLRARRLYGAAAADIPQLRAVLAGVLADLLLCDALTTLAVRDTENAPDSDFVPRVLQAAMDRLSLLMGSRFYIRQGEHAVFQLLLSETQQALFVPGRPPRSPSAPVPLNAATALCDPELLAAAPGRTLFPAATRRRAAQPAGPVQERLYEELVRRYEASRAFDLTERPLPDRP
ncbi:hypothetical protein EJ357_00995 [Streptomyces cyaneochromogenes]|uniref:Acyl-CoA dehydrogenase n=1 Tax=Streptomyces cyaneochromogenes TaxID=2496836 RepID=A0A3Q9ENS4_9ACTN|nr:hypothetical protein [Streptomyces cyaneochromogenes]AZQ32227.1 hypothetical protein EJ357_00995 [Streptomyces cyaneochromogenes]